MNRTPADTRCPTAEDWRRLLLRTLPTAEAARLEEHARQCPACHQVLHALQGDTVATPIPSLPDPSEDTRHGEPNASAPSPVTWTSEFILEGAATDRPAAAASPPPPLLPRRTFNFLAPAEDASELGWLGSYRITGVLGEGGMGFVFDAEDTHLQRRVALKVLKPELAANLSFRERFLQEARAAAGLANDHIITIYQVGMENDVPYLAMQYLAGETVEQRLQREQRLRPAEVVRIGRQVAEGLAAAHAKGLIHRDIKPANLWLEEPGDRIKVLDFGLARLVNDSRRLTATGLIVGTPSYLAPEQARGLPLDFRCDLFSLGCVLYRLVTGALPFDGPDTLAQLTALAIADPRPVEELSPDVPAGLRNVIHRLLARNPADRPESARALAAELRALEQGTTLSGPGTLPAVVPPPPSPPPPPPAVPSRRPSGITWTAAGLAMLSVLLLGSFVLWRVLGGRDPDSTDASPPPPAPSGSPIKVGVLFSLTGTMQAGGTAAHDAALLAIEELNEKGGLLGRPVEAVVKDGHSDYNEFTRQAEKLISREQVSVIVGCRTSSARKAVLPVVEEHDHLLLYPMQFEGLEESPNIVYLGAAPNQQILPAVRYAAGILEKRRFFLVGSDYVFPHTANAIIRDALRDKKGVEIVGEAYIPFGSTEVGDAVKAIVDSKPDMILNTINGDTNTAFFRALRRKGLTADKVPVLSFSIGENDLRSFSNRDDVRGHLAAWNYFQSIDRPQNEAFIRKFRDRFGPQRVLSDPMEATYFGLHLWAQAVTKAQSTDPRAVRQAIKGLSLNAPEGEVRIDPKTHYTWKVVRLGKIVRGGQFEVQWSSEKPIPPEPFPPTRTREEWEQFLKKMYDDWGGHWEAPHP